MAGSQADVTAASRACSAVAGKSSRSCQRRQTRSASKVSCLPRLVRSRFVCGATPQALRIAPWTGSEAQEQALQELLQQFQRRSLHQPTVDEAQWFLRDRSFDVEEAFEKLSTCLQWRAQFGLSAVTWQDVQQEAATGKAYLHDHVDQDGRPALVVRVARHCVGEFSEWQSQALCAYYVERAIAARPPGVDTILGVFDVSGFGPRNADFAFVRFLVQCFFFYYPKRAGEVLMVDAPWAFMPPYKLMQPLLGKYGDLVKFVPRREAMAYFAPGKAPPDLQA